MPDFVASTTQFAIGEFISLFTTMLSFVITELWPYLIGIGIVLLVVRYGKRLLRIGM